MSQYILSFAYSGEPDYWVVPQIFDICEKATAEMILAIAEGAKTHRWTEVITADSLSAPETEGEDE